LPARVRHAGGFEHDLRLVTDLLPQTAPIRADKLAIIEETAVDRENHLTQLPRRPHRPATGTAASPKPDPKRNFLGLRRSCVRILAKHFSPG
jgi:hypothetical protein